jgi:hypothetical protein
MCPRMTSAEIRRALVVAPSPPPASTQAAAAASTTAAAASTVAAAAANTKAQIKADTAAHPVATAPPPRKATRISTAGNLNSFFF